MSAKDDSLEVAIRSMTMPVDGQYPRPWMTTMTRPASASVFIVGKNQKNGFAVDKVGSHDHYIDALFNRGPETCRQLYDRVARKSPTRNNIDKLSMMLRAIGVDQVVETNVICFSTNSSRDFANGQNAVGKEVGLRLFSKLVELVQPKVIIAHGVSTAKYLAAHLKCHLPRPPAKAGDNDHVKVGEMSVFVIPTLDPRPMHFPTWSAWRDPKNSQRSYLDDVCERVAKAVAAS